MPKPIGYWQGQFSKEGGATLYEEPQESQFRIRYPNIPLYEHPRNEMTEEKSRQILDIESDKDLFSCDGVYGLNEGALQIDGYFSVDELMALAVLLKKEIEA
jgi:hypothetical protein